MLHLTHAIVARAALAASCVSTLAAPAQLLLNPAPCVRAADAAPAADVPPGLADLEQLAELERSATDLEGLRGGEWHFTTGETVLLVLGVVILIVLIA